MKAKHEFGVRAPEEGGVAFEQVIEKIKQLNKKYGKWVYIAGITAILLSFRYPVIGNKYILPVFLAYVVIGNGWPLVEYIRRCKSREQQIRRVIALTFIVVFLFGVGLYVKYYLIGTDLGRTMQGFFYPSSSAPTPPDTQGLEILLPEG